MIRFLGLSWQYDTIKAEVDHAIAQVIPESAFIAGKYAARFEDEFARFNSVQNCVGVGNGTDALEIAIEALGLPAGAEIAVPANSFVACFVRTVLQRKAALVDAVVEGRDVAEDGDILSELERLIGALSPRLASLTAAELSEDELRQVIEEANPDYGEGLSLPTVVGRGESNSPALDRALTLLSRNRCGSFLPTPTIFT